MIKCLFVDVVSIRSDIAKSEFDESKIEQLADSILATDGLLRPLILKQTGLEFTVIEGHLEYYAVVRAKEKNPRQAEMVNAFLVNDLSQSFATEQIALLSGVKPNPTTSSTNISVSIEHLTSIIAQQLQHQLSPITQRLDKQDQILGSINSAQVEKVISAAEQPKIIELTPLPKVVELTPEIKVPVKATRKKAEPVVKAAQTAKKTKAATKNKVQLDPSIDPIKVSNTLNLINTLSVADLQLKMTQCAITSAAKLAPNIVNQRNIQPGAKFDSWEIVILKVPGLAATTAKNIINKLR